jgi:hypothetical protein
MELSEYNLYSLTTLYASWSYKIINYNHIGLQTIIEEDIVRWL